jgi:hypothetical protein
MVVSVDGVVTTSFASLGVHHMTWSLVAREEQLECLRTATSAACGGPLVITGEPRMGRTSLLHKALTNLDERTTAIVRLGHTGDRTAFAALSMVLPPDVDLSTSPTVDDITRVFTTQTGGRRLVVVADDAHLVDQPSMLVARELHRRVGALLLVSQPNTAVAGRPDPLDCLRHEPGLRTLPLPPLHRDEIGALTATVLGGPVRPATVAALHAATHGNPGLLHDLLVDGGLARLRTATEEAWRGLELDRADELCRLASWSGLAAETAPTWAVLLLLSGRPTEGLHVLDTFGERSPRTALARALLLALGQGRPPAASELLAEAARDGGSAATLLLAARAWLLAIGGDTGAAEAALTGLEPGADREAYVFALAARAVIATAGGDPGTAVGHLRRALLGARINGKAHPWLAPYLTAGLIDALLLAGRISEATAASTDFHAGQQGCGWRVAVGIADLIASAKPATTPAESAR